MRLRKLYLSIGIICAIGAAHGSARAQCTLPPVWETTFGAGLGLGDDSTSNSTFGSWSFSFPLAGTTYSSSSVLSVSSNGFLSIGGDNGSDCCAGDPAAFVADPFARISVFWADLDPSTVGDAHIQAFDDHGLDGVMDRLVVTWDTIFIDNATQLLAQAQLFKDGTIVLGYGNLDLMGFDDSTLIGVTPAGGVVDPGSVDFTTAVPFDSGPVATVYELWTGMFGGPSTPVDIACSNVVFQPNGMGGYAVSDTLAPVNDNCIDRLTVNLGATPGTLLGATNDGTASCDSAAHVDTWYSYIPASDGLLEISTCGTHDLDSVDGGMDAVLSVFDGCGGLELACNDNASGLCLGDQGIVRDAAVMVPAVTGQEIVIRVAAVGGGASFVLNIGPVQPPINDDCTNRIAIASGATSGTLLQATNDGTSSCGLAAASPDVWYSYVAPSAGTLDINTCGTHDAGGVDTGTDIVLTAFDACGGAEIGCNDNNLATCSGDSGAPGDAAISLQVAAGQEVIVRVATFDGNPGGAFELNVTCRAGIWEPAFGPALGLTDDSTDNSTFADWNFSFPFAGTTYSGTDTLSVASNGFLSLGGDNGSDCCEGDPAAFVSDSFARIAVFWVDLYPDAICGLGDGFISALDDYGLGGVTDRLVITWDTILLQTFQPIQAQAQLFADGTIVLGYGALNLSGLGADVLIGVTPAGGVLDPGSTDFTSQIPLNTGTESTIYELWTGAIGGPDTPVDIECSNIVLRPNGSGGYFVGNTLAPDNDSCAGAATVSVGTTRGTLIGATSDGTASCGGGGSPDAWYSFIVPCDGIVHVDTCGTHDAAGVDTGMNTTVTVFDACGGIELACNDDATPPCTADTGVAADAAVSLPLVAGQEIVIRVAAAPGTGGGPFLLNIECAISCATCEGIRGDANMDLGVNLTDAVYTLAYLFSNGAPPLPCEAVADTNGDGSVNLTDAIYLLAYLFSNGAAPVTPGFPNVECLDLP